MPFGFGGKKDAGLEFKGEYLGGHTAYPKKKDVKLVLEPQSLAIRELGLNLAYKDISSIENMTKEKMSAKRVILLGVVGALWKKEELYMVLTYNDPVIKADQSMIFKMEKLDEAQPAIYQRIAAARASL